MNQNSDFKPTLKITKVKSSFLPRSSNEPLKATAEEISQIKNQKPNKETETCPR